MLEFFSNIRGMFVVSVLFWEKMEKTINYLIYVNDHSTNQGWGWELHPYSVEISPSKLPFFHIALVTALNSEILLMFRSINDWNETEWRNRWMSI
jgi:hypothetical protein